MAVAGTNEAAGPAAVLEDNKLLGNFDKVAEPYRDLSPVDYNPDQRCRRPMPRDMLYQNEC
jgi:hypothetical protein